MKNRILTINDVKCEIIGVAGNYKVLINDASHPAFLKFHSIRDAIIRFKQWIKNTNK